MYYTSIHPTKVIQLFSKLKCALYQQSYNIKIAVYIQSNVLKSQILCYRFDINTFRIRILLLHIITILLQLFQEVATERCLQMSVQVPMPTYT